MLAEFFESPSRIQELRDGPDGRLLDGFAQELCQAGYAEITVIAPKLRTGRFKATDKLLALLKATTIMRSDKTAE